MIAGPTITHRGVRELVFIADPHDNLYAVDADLGTLFWKRHFDVSPMPDQKSKSPCGLGVTFAPAAPVIEPDPDEEDDDNDDEAGPMRPLYAVASDGRLHTIRVSDGADTHSPVNFLPPNARYSSLNFWSGNVYAATCNGAPNGLWSIDVKRPGAKPGFYSAKAGHQIAISPAGTVYGAILDGIVALQPGSLRMKQFSKTPAIAVTTVKYQGRELIAAETQDGRLLLLDGRDLSVVAEYQTPFTRFNGLASWQDSRGVRWIYAAGEQNLRAFRLAGPSSGPKLELAWTYESMGRSGPPAVTNGVLFLLTGAGEAGPGYSTLIALDAATGKELYTSGTTIRLSYVPYLAVANGHVCFGNANNTLYCFGLPMER